MKSQNHQLPEKHYRFRQLATDIGRIALKTWKHEDLVELRKEMDKLGLGLEKPIQA